MRGSVSRQSAPPAITLLLTYKFYKTYKIYKTYNDAWLPGKLAAFSVLATLIL